MKKIVFLIFLCFCFINNSSAKEIVSLDKCVDGDTAWFYLDNDLIKTRFLAIDTPESTNKKERLGDEASSFTCNILKSANKIEIEYDDNSDKLDKYDRHLVWVFVDDKLLQTLLIENGLAKVAYLYGDYKYTDILKKEELIAKTNKIGIWSENSFQFSIIHFLIIIIFIIFFITNKKFRNKTIKKIKKNIH